MAYSRTRQMGDIAVNLPIGTTGSGGAVNLLENYGISQITATSADVYVLAAPIAGCEKTLVFHTYSTTALPVVKLCTAGAQTISLLGSATNNTVIKSAATKSTVAATVVQLKGLNSTSWIMTNVWPTMAGVTTGSTIVASGIAISST